MVADNSRPQFPQWGIPLLLGSTIGMVAILLRDPVWVAAGIVACLSPLAWFVFSVPRGWLIPFFAGAILLPPLPLGPDSAGVHLSVLLAGLGVLGGLVRAREWRFQPSLLNLALLSFYTALAFSLVSALFYSGFAAMVGSAARVALFGIAVYVFFSASQGPDRTPFVQAQTLARVLFAIAALAALFGILDFIFQLPAPAGFGAQFLWLDSGVYRRAQGLFYEASTLGNFCAFFLVMSVAAIAQPPAKRILPRWLAATGIVLFAGTLMLTFSRAAGMAACVSCAIVALLERRNWANRRAMLAVGILVLTAVALFSFFLPEFAAGYSARLASNSADIFATPERVLSGRMETWRTLAAFMADHPWKVLLGIGYKTLPNTAYFGAPLIADNMYLSALIETGVFGLASLLLLNIAVLHGSWRSLRAGSFFGKWMFCFWVGEVLQMFTADVLTYWRVLPIYLWVLAQAMRELTSGEAGD